MKEEIYRWVKTIAFFYIVFSAVLHLVPDVKYERYIRSFMGILLIYILSTPVFNLFGNGEKLLQEFRLNYQEELTVLEEKNTERINAINKFTLMDDTFMTQVFSGDLECTEELLKIILKRNDLSVTKSITQLTIGNLFGRSVRLDIYANDTNGKQYDIEVQRDNSGAAPERARLNSALFDSRLTTSGEKYMEMPETYIIFITSNDVLDGGLPIYTIERTVQETGELFGDKAHIVYVNGSYRGNDEIGWLMHDFNCKDYQEMHNPKIAERVRYFKEEPKGVTEMCETMQKIVDRERDDAAVKARMDIALTLWSEGEHDLDKISRTTKLSIEQVRRAITVTQPA